MNETEYTANAIRCLERGQDQKSPDRAHLRVLQATVWASLAQTEQLTRIADYLAHLSVRFGADIHAPMQPICTCGGAGFPDAVHADDCPRYVPED